jgi:hypothetical protein
MGWNRCHKGYPATDGLSPRIKIGEGIVNDEINRGKDTS